MHYRRRDGTALCSVTGLRGSNGPQDTQKMPDTLCEHSGCSTEQRTVVTTVSETRGHALLCPPKSPYRCRSNMTLSFRNVTLSTTFRRLYISQLAQNNHKPLLQTMLKQERTNNALTNLVILARLAFTMLYRKTVKRNSPKSA